MGSGRGRPALRWPDSRPAHGPVRLRAFSDDDTPLALALSTDPYVPVISTLTAAATHEQALEWIRRQGTRHLTGTGWSFAIADRVTDVALGQAGLWPREGRPGLASVGYCTDPASRGRGVATAALQALTAFAWTVQTPVPVVTLELLVEPWNTASIRVAERAGYDRDRLVPDELLPGGRRADVVRFVVRRVAHPGHDQG